VSTIHSLVYTQKLGTEQISLSYSLFGNKSPGLPFLYLPSLSAAWRHEIHSVPSFIIPEYHGAISGIVFRDDESKGIYETGMPPMSGAQVVLDDTRKAETGATGLFRFSHVTVGKHQLAVFYKSDKPTFFSTQSNLEAHENTIVNFGIGFSLSGLIGRIANDAGQGLKGVKVTIRAQDKRWTATTDSEGSFQVRQLPEGVYQVEIDEDSIPEGYLTSELAAQNVQVGAKTPGNTAFAVRALRAIGGRVLAFDRTASKEFPVPAEIVTLKELAKTSTTDAGGRYMFRDLKAGSYTVAVATAAGEITKSVMLPAGPLTLTNVDLQINEKAAPVSTQPAAPAPVAAPAPAAPVPAVPPPATPATTPVMLPEPASAPKSEAPPAGDALEHERIGRQKLGAMQYKEAIAELSEAIRLAPEYAPAYNARGFAWYRLYDFSSALQDLDRAIELNPTYANAYHNRGVVRKAAGDLSGSDADFRRESMLLGAPSSSSQPPSVIRDGAGARKRIETAQRLMKSWQYQEAIDELNAAIRMAPDFATAYNERGFAWFKLSEYARAIADLDSAIRLNPKYANAYHIRGVVREAQGDHAGAEMDIRREKLLRLALISTR